MAKSALLKTGVIGTFLAAVCCFTPLLVWLLTFIGLTAIIAYLDYVLLPILFIFIAITGYSLWRRSKPV